MTNNDPSPAATDQPDPLQAAVVAASQPGTALIEEGICGTCGYQLKGLDSHGTCPECGTAYTPETMSPLATAPGALEIVLRFFWPIVLLLGLGYLSAAASVRGDPYGWVIFLLYSMPILLLVFPLNSLVQSFLMARRHIQPAHRSRLASRNIRILGTAAKAAFYTTAIAPPLIVGGCVLVMCGGGL